MSNQTKQYRPLTGPEIIDYICTEFRKALVQSGQLPLHRAFHEMSFVGGIKVSGWGTADAKVQFSGSTNGNHPDDAVPVEFKVGIEAEAEPPSLVRERMAGNLPTGGSGEETQAQPSIAPMPESAQSADVLEGGQTVQHERETSGTGDGNLAEGQAVSGTPAIVNEIHQGEAEFVCGDCVVGFANRDAFDAHNARLHNTVASGGIPCPNFGHGCDHVPFASKAAMISHRNNWCAVSGRRRR